MASKITNTANAPSLKILHIMAAHPPITLDKSCQSIPVQEPTRKDYSSVLSCMLDKTSSLLRRMKEIGVYDKTTIVLIGDHGETLADKGGSDAPIFGIVPRQENRIGRFSPMLAIKPAGATGPFKLNSAPAQISDLRATLCGERQICKDPVQGENLLTLAADAARTRGFIDFSLFFTDISDRDGLPAGSFVRFMTNGLLSQSNYDMSQVPTRRSIIGGNGLQNYLQIKHASLPAHTDHDNCLAHGVQTLQ
jgi:hypothetical protein